MSFIPSIAAEMAVAGAATTAVIVKNILRQNSHGYWYSIPESMKAEFIRLDEAMQNTLFLSNEYYVAYDEFDKVFEFYRKED